MFHRLLLLSFAVCFSATFVRAQFRTQWEVNLASAVRAAQQRHFVAAEQFLALALRESESFSQSDPRLGATLNSQGLIYMAEGKAKEAEQPFRRALEVFEKAHGAKSMDAGGVMFNLADSLARQERYDATEPILQKTLEIYQTIIGKDSPKMAQVLFRLGDSQRHNRNFGGAEVNLKKAADMEEVFSGVDSTGLAAVLNSLALCYTAESKYAQAEPLFKLSLNIREAKYGLTHKEVVESLDNYAAMLRDAGRAKEGGKLTALADAARKSIKAERQPIVRP